MSAAWAWHLRAVRSSEPYVTVFRSAWRNFPEDLDCQRHRYDTFIYILIPSVSNFSLAFRIMSVLCAFCPLHHTGIIYPSLISDHIGRIFCSAAFLSGKEWHTCRVCPRLISVQGWWAARDPRGTYSICGRWCASTCNTDTTQTQPHQISNTQRTENKTTDVVIQQHSRKLLMMDILMSETCWVHKQWNKIASDIKLVFYSSTVTEFSSAYYLVIELFV